jgi:hypothetical protein
MKPPLSVGRWANLLRPRRPYPEYLKVSSRNVACTKSGNLRPELVGPLRAARGLAAPFFRQALYRPLSPRERIRLFSISNNMTKATSPAVVE